MDTAELRSRDGELPSTTEGVIQECPSFRILTLGKSGAGKSSLINSVFGIELTTVSHQLPGESAINTEFRSDKNRYFVLHDSKGFEPGEVDNFNIVKTFIEARSKMVEVGDRLHAIWFCIEIPVAGGRVIEKGDEQFLNLDIGQVPVIVVFTKDDLLAKYIEMEADDAVVDGLGDDGFRDHVKAESDKRFHASCVRVLDNVRGQRSLPYVRVSTKDEASISDLIKLTQECLSAKRHPAASRLSSSQGDRSPEVAPSAPQVGSSLKAQDRATRTAFQASSSPGPDHLQSQRKLAPPSFTQKVGKPLRSFFRRNSGISQAGERAQGPTPSSVGSTDVHPSSDVIESSSFYSSVSSLPRDSRSASTSMPSHLDASQSTPDVVEQRDAVELMWSIAQRGDADLKVNASITVGRKRYWRALASSVHFPGKTLEKCLSVIHRDICTVWNFNDDENANLTSPEFKALMTNIISDLGDTGAPNPNINLFAGFNMMIGIAGICGPAAPIVIPIAAAFVLANWVHAVYQNTTTTLRRLMGYIVDLTIVMQSLFWLMHMTGYSSPVTRRLIKLAFNVYNESKEKKDVHRRIHAFVKELKIQNRTNADSTQDEIVELIRSNRFNPTKIFERIGRPDIIGQAGSDDEPWSLDTEGGGHSP